ncbi:MAG: hypothetical protein ABIJ92_05025 [Candidatus Aenigmatarchaeota archaeon]
MGKRKGQLVFEFIIAAILLFGIIIYSINYLNTSVNVFRSDSYGNELELKTLQTSEMLVGHKGSWSGGNPDIIGLAHDSGWPVLDSTKLSDFDNTCDFPAGYSDILDKLDLLEATYLSVKSNYDLKVQINQSGTLLVECNDPALSVLPTNRRIAHVQRYALTETGEILDVDVWVW